MHRERLLDLAPRRDPFEREVGLPGRRLRDPDHGPVRVGHRSPAHPRLVDVDDLTPEPVERPAVARYVPGDEPGLRVAGEPHEVLVGIGGGRGHEPALADHEVRDDAPRRILHHVAEGLRLLAGGVLELQLRVAFGLRRLRLDPDELRGADEQAANLRRLRGIAVPVGDRPASVREGEGHGLPLVGGLDARHVPEPRQQLGEQLLPAPRDARVLTLDEDRRRGRGRDQDGEDDEGPIPLHGSTL